MRIALGSGPTGLANNFAYGTLALGNITYVKLVDQSLNSAGSSAEAVYANSLVVPAGCTLHLNGFHLCVATLAQVAGTITGNAAGSSAASADYGPVTPLASPAVPANVQAMAQTVAINVNWDPVAGAAKYQVERSTAANSGYFLVSEVASGVTTYQDSSV